MEIVYLPKAFEDILFWKKSGNKQIQEKIFFLLKSIKKTPFEALESPRL